MIIFAILLIVVCTNAITAVFAYGLGGRDEARRHLKELQDGPHTDDR